MTDADIRETILNSWLNGLTAKQIAESCGKSRGYVCNLVLRARDKNDPRAVRRPTRQGAKANG